MIKAKIKPSSNTCCGCLDTQIDEGLMLNCMECGLIKDCKVLSFGKTFRFGDYAIVLVDKKIKKISINDLFDVEEI